MPAGTRFDTLDYAQKLERAGVPAEQAALQAKAFAEAIAGWRDCTPISGASRPRMCRGSRISTCGSLISKRGLVRRSTAVRSEWIGEIETLRWMFGVLVALNGATLIRLFFRQ
jgi:hypothetical protein